MSLKKCGIIFNNHTSNVFYNGQTVAGFINLVLDKKKKCEAFTLKVYGEANCQWTEAGGKGETRRATEFSGKEIYFDFKMDLIAPTNASNSTELMAGSQNFNFSFVLPQNLPSSFEGPYGYIRYTAQVIFKRSNRKDLQYKVSFMVLSNVDLNFIPNSRTPIKHVACKDFHFLLKSMGYVKGNFEIPVSAFVPGENLLVKCNLENKSKVKIEEIRFSLVKMTIFKASCPFSNQKEEVNSIARSKSIGVDKEEEKFVFSSMLIPPTPPTSFLSCSIIEIKYELKINLVASAIYGNLKFSIPIVIGTAPLSFHHVQATTSQDLDAPPPYSELALPSYKEAIVEKRVKGEYEDWDHSPNFTPRYPVFQTSCPEQIESSQPNSSSMIDNIWDSIKNTDVYKTINKNIK